MASTGSSLALASAVLVLAGCSSSAAQATATEREPAGRHANLSARLDRIASRALAREGAAVAGFSVAVVWRGDLVLAKGYGLADIDTRRPVAADSIFRIASVTKQFTAAAVMKLVDAGKIRLDDPITAYLPDYPTREKITIRQLLTHTSGVKSYTELPSFPDDMTASMSRAQLVAKFAAEPLDFEPGARWHYSNSGYYLLGMVIEAVSGRSYADYLDANVFASAGLADTASCPDAQDYPRAAHGYRQNAGKLEPPAPLSMAYPFAAGALCSTAADLVTWGRALATHRIVDESAWKQMTSPVVLSDGSSFRYGFGLFLDDLAGHPSVSHGGGINGFASALRLYPADDLYVAVLVNTEESSLADLLSVEIARSVLGVPEPEVTDQPIPAADAAAIAGTYRFDTIGTTVEVYVKDGAVMTRNAGSTQSARLRAQGDGSYLVPELEARILFEFKRGKVINMRIERSGAAHEGARVP
ncbi:MAG TPA: serine hydrolase domain-containing protein [Kofleriaceae bacterium]|nr:serine hydrolase domain-containing protein [Kofleriaceae bacterium]